ncbi:MAG TPA: methyltransferase domain-containing protein [Actinomycetota bacterium]|nr:methyltransferase domain-containing protein [Actinomycetota bacterium]
MPHDWDAATYDRIADPQARWGAPVVGWLDLDGDETVLDAGCGTGRVTEAVLERLRGGRLIGLDGSAAMLAAARRRLGHRTGPSGRLWLLAADLAAPLPLAPESLDAIISTATFHWIADHQTLFRRLAAVLKPGGQLAAQCGGAGNIASVRAALHRVTGAAVHPDRWDFSTPEQARERLERAGFVEVETWLTEEPTHYTDRAELESFLKTVVLWPFLEGRPEAEHDAFVTRVAGELPGMTLDYVRLNLRARLSG